MRLLDTDILIGIQRGHLPAVEWFASLDELPGVPGFVAMELYQGASDAQRIREVENLLAPLAIVWPSETDCQRALTDFRNLHLSHGLGLLDALIAATAIGQGATLVAFNARHFFPVSGLTTEQSEHRDRQRRFLAAASARAWGTARLLAGLPTPADATPEQRHDWLLRRVGQRN